MKLDHDFSPKAPSSTRLLLLLAAIVLAIQYMLPSSAPPPYRPNVLLLTVDTLRADELGVYGSAYPTTPHLDRFARQAKTYEMAIAPSPWTLPSMATLMTGLEPKAHGSIFFQRPLPDGAPTMAEKLKRLGYHTSAAVTHVLLSSAYGFHRGFDRFETSLIPSTDQEAHLSINSDRLAKIGVEMVQSSKQPFFVWLHFFDPHFHYLEHPPISLMSDPGPEGRNLYRGEISFTDKAIGEVLAAADALKYPPLVILTADHGEQFKEHGSIHHTTALYQEVVHVPLLVREPAASAEIKPGPFRMADAFSLVMRLIGLSEKKQKDAVGIEDEPPVLLHSEQASNLRGLMTNRSKLIVDLRKQKLELYDLYEDPAERINLAEQKPQMVESLCGSLTSRFNELGTIGARLRTAADLELTQEQRDQFESLGYIGAGAGPDPKQHEGNSLCDFSQSPAP